MWRRHFLEMGMAAAASAAPARPGTAFDDFFLPILEGFLRNARRTSASWAVCDYPQGTILPGAVGASGKTYDSVTRMLPAIAAWVAGGRPTKMPVDGSTIDLEEVLLGIFRHAFDPRHPDYWLDSGPKQNQRQVESSVVAWSLWLLRDRLLDKLTPAERTNVQNWLAGCTRVPVRTNNWAWFTAVNQAARLSLSKRWPEFSGDTRWMLDDIAFLEGLARGDGWFTDSPKHAVYDYYNFWVFASHYIYWNRIIGTQYPEISKRLGGHLRQFLAHGPEFFGADGAHVLFGRSLIYRWGVLTPLVLAYLDGGWPHSAGVLRRLVRRNLEWHRQLGSYDAGLGKLRETFSAAGTRNIAESYIDNGHPYWGMQAFAFFLIPPSDRFWTAPEDPLPAERGDFRTRLAGPRMMLAGTRRTGEVRWLQSLNANDSGAYRDKYGKFVYSSHFPPNVMHSDHVRPADRALVFRSLRTGHMAARRGVVNGQLLDDGVRIEWWSDVDGARVQVTSTIRLDGEFEIREHRVSSPVAFDTLEGSAALGLAAGESYRKTEAPKMLSLGAASGLVCSWIGAGYDALEATEYDCNLVFPRSAVAVLRGRVAAGESVLRSLHHASPAPLPRTEIAARAAKLLTRF